MHAAALSGVMVTCRSVAVQPTLPCAFALAPHRPTAATADNALLCSLPTAGELSPNLAWFLVVGLAAVGFTITSASCLWVTCTCSGMQLSEAAAGHAARHGLVCVVRAYYLSCLW